ncbi:MAG: hypothetical protein RLY31_929 [Bacteroidota bacterium]|jgi:tyrosine-protein phosphatase YwqE
MHSHLVPGVDDGSSDEEESISLLRGLASLGYRKVITTPHIRPEYFPNTPQVLTEAFGRLQTAVRREGLDISLRMGAEYYLDTEFIRQDLSAGDLLTVHDNFLLVEISMISPPPNLLDILFQLRIKGYQPILAHPERYVGLRSPKAFEKLKEFGCLFQLNLLSMTGYYGKEVKALANTLWKKGMIDLVGTDLHNARQLELIRSLAETHPKLLQRLRDSPLRNELLT